MGQFVGDHPGVFVQVLGMQQQAEVDAQYAPRRREGVDLFAVDQHRAQHPLLELAVLGQIR